MTLLPVINQQLAILLAAKLAALAILVSCAEYLVLPRPLQDSGLMSWAVGRLRSPLLVKGPTGRVLNWLLAYPRILGLIALRAAIALLILFGPSAVVLNPLLLCLLVLLSMLLTIRNAFGTNGADQMGDILFVGLAVVSIVTTHTTISVWYPHLRECQVERSTPGKTNTRQMARTPGDYLGVHFSPCTSSPTPTSACSTCRWNRIPPNDGIYHGPK